MFTITLNQYLTAKYKELKADYNITKDDFSDYVQMYTSEYWNEVEQNIESGKGVSNRIADRLHNKMGINWFINYMNKYPKGFSQNYVCPSGRKIQTKHKREMIEARRAARNRSLIEK